MRKQIFYSLFLVFTFHSCIPSNPNQIKFVEVTFKLTQQQSENLLILGQDTLKLGQGDIFIYDFNKDGLEDFCVYRKNNDLRDHFGWADVYLNSEQVKGLGDLSYETGKFKENHWVRIDTKRYPGMEDPKFLNLIRGIENNIK